jgi:hypothetical protein
MKHCCCELLAAAKWFKLMEMSMAKRFVCVFFGASRQAPLHTFSTKPCSPTIFEKMSFRTIMHNDDLGFVCSTSRRITSRREKRLCRGTTDTFCCVTTERFSKAWALATELTRTLTGPLVANVVLSFLVIMF